jgi:hypothetical protein
MWVLDNLTPRTVVRTGSCTTTFCFASSQMITWTPYQHVLQRNVSRVTNFVLWKLGLFSSSDERDEVGLP